MNLARTLARNAACAGAGLGLLLFGAAGVPAQQPVLWQTAIPGHEAAVLPVALAVGGWVYAAGWEPFDLEDETQRGVIAAFDAKSGALQWSTVGDPPTGESEYLQTAGFNSLASAHGVLLVGGHREVGEIERESVVRAYDRKSGALLWSRQIPALGGTYVAAAGQRAFVVTTLGEKFGPPPSIFLTAHDLHTGAVLWSHGDTAINASATGIVVTGKRVAVIGYVNQGPGSDPGLPDLIDALVRVHHVETGAILWQDVFDGAGGIDYAIAAAIKGSRLIVGGTTSLNASAVPRDGYVSCYDLESGEVLWSPSLAEEGNESVRALAVGGNTVTTLAFKSSGLLLRVRSHSLKTGAVKWLDAHDEPVLDYGLATGGQRVVIGSTAGTYALENKDGGSAWTSPWLGTSAAIVGKRVFVPGVGGVAAFELK